MNSSSGPASRSSCKANQERQRLRVNALELCDMTNRCVWKYMSYTSKIHPNLMLGKAWFVTMNWPVSLCVSHFKTHPIYVIFKLLRMCHITPCRLQTSEAQQSDSLSEQYEQRVQARMSICCWRFHLSQHKCCWLLYLHRSTFPDINKCIYVIMHYMHIGSHLLI